MYRLDFDEANTTFRCTRGNGPLRHQSRVASHQTSSIEQEKECIFDFLSYPFGIFISEKCSRHGYSLLNFFFFRSAACSLLSSANIHCFLKCAVKFNFFSFLLDRPVRVLVCKRFPLRLSIRCANVRVRVYLKSLSQSYFVLNRNKGNHAIVVSPRIGCTALCIRLVHPH